MNDVKGISCISGHFVNTASGMTKAALAAAESMKGEYAGRDAGFCFGEDAGWSVFSHREYSCVWHIFLGCAREILALQAVLQHGSRYRRYGAGRRFPWHRIQKNRLLKIHLLTRALDLFRSGERSKRERKPALPREEVRVGMGMVGPWPIMT